MTTHDTTSGMPGMQATLRQLSDSWWLLLVQGIGSIIFGILALVWPGATLAVLVVLFGLFVLFEGVIDIIGAISAAMSHRPWGWRFGAGVLGVLAGLIILRWPGVTALIVLLFVGLWAIIVGLIQVIGAVADHDQIRHAWLLALSGIIAILFGIAMLVWPAAGLYTMVLLIGIFAIVYGVVFCVIAFRVRSLGQYVSSPRGQAGTSSAY